MTFKTVLLGVFTLLFGQTIFAANQVINCDHKVNIVLFGNSGIYGERFSSGLMTSPLPNSKATLSAQAQGGPSGMALLAGRDYEGNAFEVSLPGEVIGRAVDGVFPVRAKIRPTGAKEETTLTVKCISNIIE